MPKLFRPYIPLAVRVQVASRQLRVAKPNLAPSILYGLDDPSLSDARRIEVLLRALFGDRPRALDHDPALVNRRQRVWADGSVTYTPRANDPDHLVYRESGPGSDHDIKTRVRGDGALRSDLGQARYNKRVARNRSKSTTGSKSTGFPKRPPRLKVGDIVTWTVRGRKRTSRIVAVVGRGFRSSANKLTPKRKWPSRPFERRP